MKKSIHLLLLFLFVLLPILGSILSHTTWKGINFNSEPVHTFVETIGTVVAIILGVVLPWLVKYQNMSILYYWLASGFLASGFLAGLHACFHPGQEFVFLYCSSELFGGIFFFCVCLPKEFLSKLPRLLPIILAICISFVLGFIANFFPAWLPLMVKDATFTPIARGFNLIGGALFWFASFRFVQLYLQNKRMDDILFAYLSFFLGLSGILFEFSKLWDSAWWLWHLVKLLGYCIASGYLLAIFSGLHRQTYEQHEKNSKLVEELSENEKANQTMMQRLREEEQANQEMLQFSARMLQEIDSVSKEIDITSKQILEKANVVLSGSAKQATTIGEINLSVNDMNSHIAMNMQNVNKTSDFSSTTKEMTLAGKTEMSNLVISFEKISQATEQIKRIIQIIANIASQTHMLAINADIEAARVGSLGSGFAVVANSVSELAQKSSTSVRDTSEVIEGIFAKVKDTFAIVKAAEERLEQISNSSVHVNEIASVLSDSNQKQVEGFEVISQGIRQIEEIVQRNASNARQNVATGEKLAKQAEKLQVLLEEVEDKMQGKFSNATFS
ncbi:MAG: methyl-accepting chemotaxis protein [Spirochaetota bacterium]